MALVKISTTQEEIKKHPELRKSDLDILRNWHKKQPHLPPISDSELILFLHGKYYRTEPTKLMIDAFFTARTHIPELYSRRDPLESKELREIMKVTCCLPLLSTTPEGYQVLFIKLLDYEPSHYVLADGLKVMLMVMELWMHTEGPSPGYIIITDMDGAVFGHLSRLNPMIMKKLAYVVQEAIPIRLKGLHFMNTPSFMDMFMNFAKPFMKKEQIDILSLHSNLDSLGKTIPIDILPNEQGGKAGPINDLWAAQVKKIEDNREWFQRMEKRRVNESARPVKAKLATDIFGVEGSFKKLDID